jgi:hypothetical protein
LELIPARPLSGPEKSNPRGRRGAAWDFLSGLHAAGINGAPHRDRAAFEATHNSQ